MKTSAGTVSKIIWHFTGGPKWSIEENKQEIENKTYEEAYEIILKYLAERR